MDPRFGGNVGAILGSQEVRPQGNYLQRQLQKFTDAWQEGGDRLKREYDNMDRKYFGGGLPFGVEPFSGIPFGTYAPGLYNMPGYGMPNYPGYGYGTIPEPAGGADFIGPRSNEILRRGIEQQIEEKRQEDLRYGSPGDLSMMMPGMMMAGAPRYIRSSPPPNIINKAPDIDSRHFNQYVERGYRPLAPPRPRGPQLPGFV